MQVDGPPEAWKLVANYPLLNQDQRRKAFAINNEASAQLLPKALRVAHKYGIHLLLDDGVDYAKSWTSFSTAPYNVSSTSAHTPTLPVWWFKLAAEYNLPQLAAPALCAMLCKSTCTAPQANCVQTRREWESSRAAHLAYGKKQEGEMWEMICFMLEGCSK